MFLSRSGFHLVVYSDYQQMVATELTIIIVGSADIIGVSKTATNISKVDIV